MTDTQSRPETVPSALDAKLCVAVYRAAHAFTAAYRTLLAPFGLTYPQYLVLVSLWDKAPRTVSELGDLTDLDSGTLSPLLRRLEGAGWVTRSRSRNDARIVEIGLTDRGRHLEQELAGVPDHLGDCVGVTVPDGDELLAGLHQLTANLRNAV